MASPRLLLPSALGLLAACGPAVDIEGVLYDPRALNTTRRDGGTVTSTQPRPDAGPRDAGFVDAGDPRCPEPTLEALRDKIFLPSCATGGCHTGPTPAEGLALDTMLLDLGARLRQPAAQSPSRMPMVTPGQPGASYLFLKVFLATPPGGGPMPPRGPLLDCELAALRRWIEAGAP